MAKIDPIARHPVSGLPYDRLEYVRLGPDRTPCYRVTGSERDPSGAFKALGHAFEMYGGDCYYCGKKFKPHRLSEGRAHRDHVIPESAGGSERLHNLVIACTLCGTKKANRPIRAFKPSAADKYIAALEAHIARALGVEDLRASSPPPPKRA